MDLPNRRPRILIPEQSFTRMTAGMNRRRFLTGLGATLAGGALLSACGDTTIINQAAPSTLVERRLRMYSWPDYDDPDQLASWGDVDIVTYQSNEDLIAQLLAAKGDLGYDIVQPSGPYVPELVREGLLEQLDLSRIPNFRLLRPDVTDQEWDRNNAYSVCKAWGTVGWLYDTAQVTEPINSWADFVTAAKGSASGKTVVVDTPPELAALYYWSHDKDWRRLTDANIKDASTFLLEELAPHLAAVDGLPYNSIVDQGYTLLQVFSGSAFSCLQSLSDAGIDTSTWKWSVGAPVTQKYVDNFCIVKGARHLDAAYEFINFMLSPAQAARASMFVLADTGVEGVEAIRPPDFGGDQFFNFTEDEVSRMQHWKLTGKEDQLVDLKDAVAAKVREGGLVKG